MKIGFEANCAVYEPAGVGEYTRQLMKTLLELDPPAGGNEYFFFVNTFRKKKERIEKVKKIIEGHANAKIVQSNWPNEWKEWLYGKNAGFLFPKFQEMDLIFAPFFSALPLFAAPKAKKVVTAHDLVFYRFPNHQNQKITNYFKKRSLLAASQADLILADSVSTKNDLVKFQKIPAEKIRVVYLGKDIIYRPSSPNTPNIPNFLLTVGTLEPRKNLVNLIKGYELLDEKTRQIYPLKIVGGRGWNNEEFDKIFENSPAKNQIQVLGYLTKEELKKLYNQASLFIYPSLFEGFGLPPLEAMASGCPVLVSTAPSLIEVVGSAGEYLDPKDPKDIAKKINYLLANPKRLALRQKEGIKQAAKFSWRKCGEETLKIYEEIK